MEDVDLNPRWKSKVDALSPEFQKTRQEMQRLVDELDERLRLSRNQGDPKSVNRHLKTGQLLGFPPFFLPSTKFSLKAEKKKRLICFINKYF